MSNYNCFCFLVILFSKSSNLIFQFCKSQSIKTGFKFCLITAKALEIIVKLGIIISSFFKFKDLIAISNAAVPFETATENFCLIFFENFFQVFNIRTIREIHPF